MNNNPFADPTAPMSDPFDSPPAYSAKPLRQHPGSSGMNVVPNVVTSHPADPMEDFDNTSPVDGKKGRFERHHTADSMEDFDNTSPVDGKKGRFERHLGSLKSSLKGVFTGSSKTTTSPPSTFYQKEDSLQAQSNLVVPAQGRQISTKSVKDDDFALLRRFDTIFLIDDSASMNLTTSTLKNPKSHWSEVRDVLTAIVGLCAEFDQNGVDVHFINSSLTSTKFSGHNIKDAKGVMKLFEARAKHGIRGSTPTAEALDLIIKPYLKECAESSKLNSKLPKPRNIIILTDGEANNNHKLKKNLIGYAKQLDKIGAPPEQLGIQFFQVGNLDGVQDFFAWLDNGLSEQNECRDIIDTKSTEEMGEEGLTGRRILTTVLGGVNRRLDKELDPRARV
ncbi:hypothetical protein BDZ91DRAFT_319504 [Kalaharituber pfeilii]|nr:hypothetical protein BDZ91DRAFT_319504 [Kalaharituber pfeilii]